jgi:sigma-B regulation protein RsbU (phosphoserine phosphatase)
MAAAAAAVVAMTAFPNLPQELAAWIAAALFLGAAVAALLLFAGGHHRRDRTLLYLALFMGIYGVRLLVDTRLGEAALHLSPNAADHVVVALSYLIPIPAILFVREVTSGRLRRVMSLLAAASAIAAGVFLAVDLQRGRPGSGSIPGNVLAIGFLLFAVALVVRKWSSLGASLGTPSVRALAAGAGAFVLAAVNENLAGLGLVTWGWRAEHFGLLALTGTIGYATAVRMRRTEATLQSIEHELATARRMQRNLLPQAAPAVAGVTVVARFQPMTAVGGDFYDYAADAHGLAVLVADVTGHGVPAALTAAMVKVAFASQREVSAHPAEALAHVNRTLMDANASGFVTAAWVHLDLAAGRLTYAAAGHPPLLVWRAASRAVERVTENGLLMGAFVEAAYSETVLPVAPGDRLLLYTDGVMEAANAADEEFGLDRSGAVFAETAPLDLSAQADAILARLVAWRGTVAQGDDVTLVLLART